MFFSKKDKPKKDKKEDSKANANEQESIQKYMSSVIVDLKADIDRLKAHGEAEKEMRSASQERFSHINETIGRLREMMIESEKKYQSLEGKASKAIELMNELNPEKIDSRIRTQNNKLEKEEIKTTSNAALIKNVIDELKSLKVIVSQFGGIEEIIRSADDIKKEVDVFNKMRSKTERYANKVENIFVSVQENFNEFQKYQQKLKDVQKSFEEIVSEFDKVQIETEKNKHLGEQINNIEKHGKLYEKKADNFIFSLAEIKEENEKTCKLIEERLKNAETIKEEYSKKFDDKFISMEKQASEIENANKKQGEKLKDNLKYFQNAICDICNKREEAEKRQTENAKAFQKTTDALVLKEEFQKTTNALVLREEFQKTTDEKIKKAGDELSLYLYEQNKKQFDKIQKSVKEEIEVSKAFEDKLNEKLKSFDSQDKYKFAEINKTLESKTAQIDELTEKLKLFQSNFISKEEIQKATNEKIKKYLEQSVVLAKEQNKKQLDEIQKSIEKEILKSGMSEDKLNEKLKSFDSYDKSKFAKINKTLEIKTAQINVLIRKEKESIERLKLFESNFVSKKELQKITDDKFAQINKAVEIKTTQIDELTRKEKELTERLKLFQSNFISKKDFQKITDDEFAKINKTVESKTAQIDELTKTEKELTEKIESLENTIILKEELQETTNDKMKKSVDELGLHLHKQNKEQFDEIQKSIKKEIIMYNILECQINEKFKTFESGQNKKTDIKNMLKDKKTERHNLNKTHTSKTKKERRTMANLKSHLKAILFKGKTSKKQ